MTETKKPSADDTVQVKPVTTPVTHDGVTHEVEASFKAVYGEVEHLVDAGIARLEKVVAKATGKTGDSAANKAQGSE